MTSLPKRAWDDLEQPQRSAIVIGGVLLVAAVVFGALWKLQSSTRKKIESGRVVDVPQAHDISIQHSVLPPPYTAS